MTARDYSETLFLPKTDFPDARRAAAEGAGDPGALAGVGLYRAAARSRGGPAEIHPPRRPALRQRQHPYRHRAQQDPQGRGDALASRCSARTPITCRAGTATACRSSGRSRRSTAPRAGTRTRCRSVEFRRECRDFAAHWIEIQREEFKRLGVDGDFDNPYTTMSFAAEARIARELMKFASTAALSRLEAGHVVGGGEDRAGRGRGRVPGLRLRQVWVKFPVRTCESAQVGADIGGASIVIWTTTPWTIPGNRAVSLLAENRIRAL